MSDSLAEPRRLGGERASSLKDRVRRRWRAGRAGGALSRGLKAYRERRYAAALRHFSAAARAGDAEAQYRLGLLYANGEGVVQHPPDAALWYERAAEQGHMAAQFQLSLAYLHGQPGASRTWYEAAVAHDGDAAEWNRSLWFPSGISLEHDYREALRWSLLAAAQGLPEAQANVGSLYLRGLGCECDYHEARRWYELAAAQGNAEAAHGLGMLFANGLGCAVDIGAAAQWYATAAEHGNDAAQVALGLMYAAGQGMPREPSRAAALFRQAAEAGNPRASYNLGLLHLRGEGVPEDGAAAESAFREAARGGYGPAMLSLARLCERDPHAIAGAAEAVLWYKHAAAAGNAEAQFALGRLYARGEGVPQQLDEAAKWFERAAEQGHATAQFNIAALHMQGIAVARDPAKSMEWYRRAAAQGLKPAEVRLAHLQLVEEDAATDRHSAFTWLEEAANRGDSEAETALALFYLGAADGTSDPARGEDLLRRAARRGHAPACVELCRLAAAGRLSETALSEAAHWQRTAAAAGHLEAQLLLARNLLQGTGCDRDTAEAALWLQKAAEQGADGAQFELGVLHYLGEGVDRDWQAAFNWYRLAAEQGNRYAQHNMAEMLLKGEGTTADPAAAAEWCTKAAEQGLPEAQQALGDLYLAGEVLPQDRETALRWFEKAAGQGYEEAQARLAELLAGDDNTEAVRLVIWDLDETFWDGTLSEGGIRAYRPENHDIVVTLAQRGIISSICSRNDREAVQQILEERGLWRYFVFPSIDWTAKGQRIAAIVEAARLRPATVLFIDDNPANRAEAATLVPGIQTADPGLLPQLLDEPRFMGKDDHELTRLRQYQLLEERHVAQVSAAADPEGFLRASDIRVVIDIDVAAHLDRAIELINRTNQLNFTKRRLPDDIEQARRELLGEIAPYYVQAGLVRVFDNYGDYGYCGFYLMNASNLSHFCFSCRTLGMGVESWLYDRLGRPDLTVVGDVLTDLAESREIDWIKLSGGDESAPSPLASVIPEMRLRGGCDLDALAHYFRLVTTTVRTETNRYCAPLFVHMDSSLQILPSLVEMPPAFFPAVEQLGYRREDFASEFVADAPPGSVLIYSAWADAYVSIYRHKNLDFAVPVSVDIYRDLTAITDEELSEELARLGVDDTEQRKIEAIVATLRADYEHEPRLDIGRAVEVAYLLFERIPPGARLFVLLPHEWEKWDGVMQPRSNAIEYNAALRRLARGYPAVTLMAMDDVVRAAEEMQESSDHFDRIVYFRMYCLIVEEIERSRQPEPAAAAPSPGRTAPVAAG